MSQIIVVKIGGNATNNLTEEFFEQLRIWRQMGKQILIVHGGGPQISEWSTQLNLLVKKNQWHSCDQPTNFENYASGSAWIGPTNTVSAIIRSWSPSRWHECNWAAGRFWRISGSINLWRGW